MGLIGLGKTGGFPGVRYHEGHEVKKTCLVVAFNPFEKY